METRLNIKNKKYYYISLTEKHKNDIIKTGVYILLDLLTPGASMCRGKVDFIGVFIEK